MKVFVFSNLKKFPEKTFASVFVERILIY